MWEYTRKTIPNNDFIQCWLDGPPIKLQIWDTIAETNTTVQMKCDGMYVNFSFPLSLPFTPNSLKSLQFQVFNNILLHMLDACVILSLQLFVEMSEPKFLSPKLTRFVCVRCNCIWFFLLGYMLSQASYQTTPHGGTSFGHLLEKIHDWRFI